MPPSLVEPRKIQVLGGSTYTVSIPKRWVDKLGIHPGDFVSLQLTKEGHLLMRSKSAPQTPEKRGLIDPKGLTPDELQRRIIGFYLAGYEKIEVRGSPQIDSGALNVIRDLPHKISGLELVQETKGRAILEDIIDPSRFSIRMAVDRMYSLLRASLVRIVDGLLGKDGAVIAESLARLEDVERLSWIVIKQQRMIVEKPALAAEMDVDTADAVNYAICALHLKSMAETCRDILELIPQNWKMKISKSSLLECVEIGNSVISVCDRGLFAFTRGDLNAGAECLSSLQGLEERMTEVRSFVTGPEGGEEGCASCLAVGSVLELFRRIAKLAANVAEVAFQRAAPYR